MRNQSTQLLGEAVQVVCEIMRSTGVGKAAAESELRSALSKAFSADDRSVPRDLTPISAMASLISRWHIEKRYVDKSGKPKALTWNGSRGSLLNLAREVNGSTGATKVVEDVVRRKLVLKTKDGRWLPKSQVTKPCGLDRPQILRTAVMLRRLLRTVSYNSARRYRGEELLFEVMTRVPRLPPQYLPAFKRFVRAQGMTYVRSVDDWLESRSLSKSNRMAKKSRETGVIVFAFEEPAVDI